ncbi:MAG: YggT family protein [bacterium]
MSFLSNVFFSIAKLVEIIITIYMWMVIIRVVLSWINVSSYNQIVRFIIQITEPVLQKTRALVPSFGGLDFSPMIVIFGLYMIRSFLVSVLVKIAHGLS